MILQRIHNVGERTFRAVNGFGDFCRFCGQTFTYLPEGLLRWRNIRLLLAQFYAVGTKSIPVVMITGLFVGMVLAVQSFDQFRQIGYVGAVGSVVNLSVVRELGPVLAGLMLAGRVGGGLTAEVGTMRVTEQIDALRAMGAEPLRVLVVPRFLACVLLIPVLVLYTDAMGIFGGFVVSVHVYGLNASEFWKHAADNVTFFDVLHGLIKCVFFGGVMSLVCCYKGFRCAPGAAGVGRACTESFVASCMAILALDFFLGMFLTSLYTYIYGINTIF